MSPSLNQSSVEDLNLALRLYRRLLVRLLAIFALGFAAVIGLGYLSTALSPPYGVYIFGSGLTTWGLIALVAVFIAELWWEDRLIGHALNNQVLLASPVLGLMSGMSVIAQRANATGMEWSGFFGPLQPIRKR